MPSTAVHFRFNEPLEPRLLLTCVIEQDAGTLRIAGDDAVQIVEVLDHGGGRISVSCADGGGGGGAPESFPFERVRLIQIATSGGADQIRYRTDGPVERAADLQIDAGEAADLVELAAELIRFAHRWDVDLGEGDDSFTALAGGDGFSDLALTLDSGEGFDASQAQLADFDSLRTEVRSEGGTDDYIVWDIVGGNVHEAQFNVGGGVREMRVHQADIAQSDASVRIGGGGESLIWETLGGNTHLVQLDLAGVQTVDVNGSPGDGSNHVFLDGHSDWPVQGATADPGSLAWNLRGVSQADLRFDLRGDVAAAVNAVGVGALHTSVQHGPDDSAGPTTIFDYVGRQDIGLVPGGASSRTEFQSIGGDLDVAAHSTNASHQLNLLASTQPGRVLVRDGQTTVIGGLINRAAQMDGAILVVSAADGPMPQSDFDATLAGDADGLMLDVDASGLHSFAARARGVQLHDGHVRAVSGDAGPSTMSLDMDRVVFTGAFDIDLLGGRAADRLFTRFSDVQIARDSLLDVLIDGMAGDDVIRVTLRGRVDGTAQFTLLGGAGEDSVNGVFRVAPGSGGGITWIILA